MAASFSVAFCRRPVSFADARPRPHEGKVRRERQGMTDGDKSTVLIKPPNQSCGVRNDRGIQPSHRAMMAVGFHRQHRLAESKMPSPDGRE